MNHGITLNDKAMAKEAFEVLHTLKSDSMADCTACVQDGLVYYKLFMGSYAEALETAQPILKKRMYCAEVPHMTYANLVVPAFEAGDVEAAANFAEAGYKLVSRNPEFVDPVASYIRYYTRVDINKAVKLYIKHLKWSFNPFSLPLARMRFAGAAAGMFSELEKTKATVKMRLPEEFAAYDTSGSYNVAELAAYHKDIALELARLFDKRNGNDGYTTLLS
jgi:hypothetical protein